MTEERPYIKYDITIQSGCALTRERIAEFADDTGDNISEKNPSFSEFTALYWVWKNIREDYIGWSHYRRRLLISEQAIDYYIEQGVDAILAEPLKLESAGQTMNVREHYTACHTMDVWMAMLEVVQKRDPDFYAQIETLSQQTEIFPVCMGIYKYEYFDCYCSWLFPILEEVHHMIGDKWDRYQNRYVAFLAERLHSMYFMYHEPDMLIVTVPYKQYASKTFSDEKPIKTPEALIERTMGMIQDRQVHMTRLYMGTQLVNHPELNSQETLQLFDILKMVEYETIFTEQTVFRYTTDYRKLTEHYLRLLEIAEWIATGDDSEQKLDQITAYMRQTKTSVHALEYLSSGLSG